MASNHLVQLRGVPGSGRDLHAVVPQQCRHAIPHERRVIGDHHPQELAPLAPAHLMYGHPAGEARQADLARLAHPKVRLVRDQFAHEGRGQHLPLASERCQPRGKEHWASIVRIPAANLAGVQADGRRRFLRERDGAPDRAPARCTCPRRAPLPRCEPIRSAFRSRRRRCLNGRAPEDAFGTRVDGGLDKHANGGRRCCLKTKPP
jgi:hypothetical protein